MKKTIFLFSMLWRFFADEHLNLIMDAHFSPYAGGEDIIEGFRLAEWALKIRANHPQRVPGMSVFSHRLVFGIH